MSIVRVKHNRENPFVQLSKKALWDESLSLKAIGLWARCMSRPDDWCFCISELVKHTKEGKKSVYSAIDELIHNGYALRFQRSTSEEKLGFQKVEYFFFEFALTCEEKVKYQEEFKKCLPRSGFAHTRRAHTLNEPLLIKSITKIDKNRERGDKPPRVPISISKTERVPHVFTTDVEHEQLLSDHGQEKTDWCYKQLSDWKQDKPKNRWRKNDYLSILRWCVDAYEEKKTHKTKPSDAVLEENRKTSQSFIEFVKKNYPRLDMRIEALHKHVEFSYLRGNYQPICISYHELGFGDQLENTSRKLNIPWKKVS